VWCGGSFVYFFWVFRGFGVGLLFVVCFFFFAMVQLLIQTLGDLYVPSVLYTHTGANCIPAGEFVMWKESTSACSAEGSFTDTILAFEGKNFLHKCSLCN